MESSPHLSDTHGTLPFETFWGWLTRHPNCILRAGTANTVLFDDDDLHWHFAADEAGLFVQVIRGKRLLGEMILDTEQIAYVEAFGEQESGEHGFEIISEDVSERSVVYFFVLSHGYEEEDVSGPGLAVH